MNMRCPCGLIAAQNQRFCSQACRELYKPRATLTESMEVHYAGTPLHRVPGVPQRDRQNHGAQNNLRRF